MTTSEDRREKNRQERITAGLHPKSGGQSLAESRRALATWSKAELIEFYLRQESDAITASERAAEAEANLREHRIEAVSVGKPPKRSTWGYNKARAFAWKLWMTPRKGREMDSELVFAAGWEAHKAITAGALNNLRAYLAKTLDNIDGTERPWTVADVSQFINDALTLEDDDEGTSDE